MNTIHKFWRWFTAPHTIAEWKWEGNRLADLPRAAYRDLLRTIRVPIIKVLANNDLIIVGDVYLNSATRGTALIQVSDEKGAEIIGSITSYDGSTAIVPPGCDPR